MEPIKIDTTNSDKCPVCFELCVTPISVPCGHTFCYLCIKGTLKFGNDKCPMCRCIIPRDYLENAVASFKTLNLGGDSPRWLYEGRAGGWWLFQNDHNDLIEKGWQLYCKKEPYNVTINVVSTQYMISFESMHQINQDNYLGRRIKRKDNISDAFATNLKVKGVAGVKYVNDKDLPAYEKKYPDNDDKSDSFNPQYGDSYVHTD